MQEKHLRLMTALLGICAILWTSGCSNQCAQLKDEYEKALAAESPFVEKLTEDSHFGVAMHMSLVNTLLNRAMKSEMDKALDLTDRVKLAGGKEISVKTEGKFADLEVFPDDSCPTCLRISGNIDGKLAVKVPILPIQRVPLRGSATIVAPVELGVEDGRGAIRLDLGQMSKIGKSSIDAEIAQLPPTWAKLLKGPLSDLLLDAVSKTAGKVTVAKFDPLDFGVEGLRVVPVRVETNAKQNSMWVGFTTNLAGATGVVKPVLKRSKTKNFAMTLHPSILASAATAAMRAGKVSRTYTTRGKKSPNGPIHVTVSSFAASKSSDNSSPFSMDFRLWNLPEDGQCYWVDATATGLASVDTKAGEISADIESMKVRESSMNDLVFAIATWGKSEFIDETRRVVSHSLSEQAFDFPGASTTLMNPTLIGDEGVLTVEGRLAIPPESNQDSSKR